MCDRLVRGDGHYILTDPYLYLLCSRNLDFMMICYDDGMTFRTISMAWRFALGFTIYTSSVELQTTSLRLNGARGTMPVEFMSDLSRI